jgi:hypothetical protein
MADETKTEEKKSSTVLSAQEIAYHAEALYKREWDAERHAIRNPNPVFLGLLSYVRLTATRLGEAEIRFAKKQEALEKRIAEFETRLTTMEKWQADAEAQTAEMVKGVEDLMTSGKMPQVIEQLTALQSGKQLPIIDAPAVIDSTAVTPLKKKPADENNKNGGAA